MDPKARLWVGSTLLVVILINYALIGVPLLSKSNSIQGKTRAILLKQAKSTSLFANSDDEFLLDLFRTEKISIDRKTTVLNAVAATLVFLAASWTVFGLVFRRR
ncbi:MAG: hypothetical protein V1682_05000 [Candidatus Omnitrophota bacterium]